MGDLDCKGYTCLLAEDIERIEGLKVQQKESSDPDLYEIEGIPVDDFTAQTDYAIALAKISGGVVRVPKRAKKLFGWSSRSDLQPRRAPRTAAPPKSD